MNEKRRLARLCLKALFYPCRAEPMPAAVAVVELRSGQMVTSPPLVTLLPVAATSQAGSSHAQHYHAFISYTIITDPEEYTSQQEWNGKIIQHHDTFVIHC